MSTVRRPSRRFVGSVLLAVIAALAATLLLFVVPRPWLTSSDVTTGAHPGYPDLQPRRYDFPPDQTLLFVGSAAARLPRWRVVRTDVPTGTVQIEVKTPLGLFTDDMTVHVTLTGPDGNSSLVTIRSRSRVGRADLGENARHIRALQAAMDDKLPRLDP